MSTLHAGEPVTPEKNVTAKVEVTIKSIQSSTGRNLQYRVFGAKEGTPVIFVHGFMGSGEMFQVFHDKLAENGIKGVALDLYGKDTNWCARNSVWDAGVDGVAVAKKEFGDTAPRIVGSSGGANTAYALCAAYNKEGKAKIPELLIASGISHNAFAHLPQEDQDQLHALWRDPKIARGPIRQLFQNGAANVKGRIADRRIQKLVNAGEASTKITAKFSAADVLASKQKPALMKILSETAATYSVPQIEHSLNMIFKSWNIPRQYLAGTDILLIHGLDDNLVPAGNAEDALRWLKEAQIPAKTKYFQQQGHLLLGSEQGLEFLTKVKK